jgi:hypothetical protein
MKYKVAEEVAEQEFERLCEANRIDYDVSDLNEEETTDWLELRGGIVKLIRQGTLVVSEDGKPIYTPPGGSKSLTFHRPTGATLMALDSHKDKRVANLTAAMADMTRVNSGEFGRMDSRDFQACGRIANLFLADRQ